MRPVLAACHFGRRPRTHVDGQVRPPATRPAHDSRRKPALAGLAVADRQDRPRTGRADERAGRGGPGDRPPQAVVRPADLRPVAGGDSCSSRVAAANERPPLRPQPQGDLSRTDLGLAGDRAAPPRGPPRPAWTYSHLAALHRFGGSVDFVPVASISAAFEEVHAGHSDYGVVPLENSTDGRIADTLDNFSRLPVKICAEVPLRIHHTLLAACDRSAIREVYSRPAGALAVPQLAGSRTCPSARLIEVTSTSARGRDRRQDAPRRRDRQPAGGRPLRSQRAGRGHRGRRRQHHPLRRDRPLPTPAGRAKTRPR